MSLLFDVFNAITGTREKPAEHHMPKDCRHVLAHMANRADNDDQTFRFGLALVETDTGLGISTVRKSVQELLERGWLVDRGLHGPPNRAVRAFEVRTSGRGWPPPAVEQRRRETPTERRRRLGLAPDGGPPPHANPASRPAVTRPRAAREPGLAPGADSPPDLPPDLPPITPPIARVHAHAGDRPAQTAIPFVASEPPQEPATETPSPKNGKKSRRAPGEPTAAQRYREAFVQGLAAGGRVVTPPTASQDTLLGLIAKTHARTAAGPIVGDALVTWIRNTATRFAKAITRPEMHRGGISAFGLQTWLDNGARAQAESFVPTDDDDPDVDAANADNPWHEPIPDFDQRRPVAPRAPLPRPDVTPEQAAAAIEWARSKGLMPRAPIGTPPPRERARG